MRRDNGPDEIYALLSAGYWGSAGQIIIRVKDGEAWLDVPQKKGEPTRKKLPTKDFEALRRFVERESVDSLPPLNQVVFDGMQFEYVHLWKTGGRRVFMNNPGIGGSIGTVYTRLVDVFLEVAGRKR